MQYDGDVARETSFEELDKYYPQAKNEIAGFFWWQGDKDRYNSGHASRYEQNLVSSNSSQDLLLRIKFVCATLGQTSRIPKATNARFSTDSLLSMAKPAYKEFKGNVASVYSHPLSQGGASNSHYGGNAETYMNIGEAMGKAMVKLLQAEE